MKLTVTLMLAAALVVPPAEPLSKAVSPTPAVKKPLVTPRLENWIPPPIKPVKVPRRTWHPVNSPLVWRSL